jgi:hypothetical protein
MDDYMQPKNDNPKNDYPIADNPIDDTVAQTDSSNNLPANAFRIDLSGLKDRAVTSEATIVGSSPETGPIFLDNKSRPTIEIEKNVEFGNEVLQSIETGREELKTEKIENANETVKTGIHNTSSVQPQKDERLQGNLETVTEKVLKKEAVKFSGYPIEESLLSDVERVKREKGNGDANDGQTAILLFLDRLFRIRDKAK